MNDYTILLLTKTFGPWSAGTHFVQMGPVVDDEVEVQSLYKIKDEYVKLTVPVNYLVPKRNRFKDWSQMDEVAQTPANEEEVDNA